MITKTVGQEQKSLAFNTLLFLCNNYIKVLHVSTFMFPVSSLSPGQFPWINRDILLPRTYIKQKGSVFSRNSTARKKKWLSSSTFLEKKKKRLIASSFKNVLRIQIPSWRRNLVTFWCFDILGFYEKFQTGCPSSSPLCSCRYLHVGWVSQKWLPAQSLSFLCCVLKNQTCHILHQEPSFLRRGSELHTADQLSKH